MKNKPGINIRQGNVPVDFMLFNASSFTHSITLIKSKQIMQIYVETQGKYNIISIRKETTNVKFSVNYREQQVLSNERKGRADRLAEFQLLLRAEQKQVKYQNLMIDSITLTKVLG